MFHECIIAFETFIIHRQFDLNEIQIDFSEQNPRFALVSIVEFDSSEWLGRIFQVTLGKFQRVSKGQVFQVWIINKVVVGTGNKKENFLLLSSLEATALPVSPHEVQLHAKRKGQWPPRGNPTNSPPPEPESSLFLIAFYETRKVFHCIKLRYRHRW